MIQRLWIPGKWERLQKEMRSVLFIAAGFAALYLCAGSRSTGIYEERMAFMDPGRKETMISAEAQGNMQRIYSRVSACTLAGERVACLPGTPFITVSAENKCVSSVYASHQEYTKETAGTYKAGIPTADIPVSDTSVADIPAVDVPAADVPAVDVPAEDTPAKDIPETFPAVLTVTVYGNGGLPESVQHTWTAGEFSEGLLDRPRRLGKEFDGWYEDAGCTIPFKGIKADQNTWNLYAGWKDFPGFCCDDRGYITGCTGSAEAISDGILMIPNHEDCVGITKEAFENVGEEVFEICIFPNITYIEPGAFAQMSNLVYIEALPGNPSYYSEEGILYNRDGTVAVYPAGRM